MDVGEVQVRVGEAEMNVEVVQMNVGVVPMSLRLLRGRVGVLHVVEAEVPA